MKIELNREYEFLYPAANYLQARQRLDRRRLRVESIRDLRQQPLDPQTIELDPMLNRGRTLVTGWDLDKDAERTFYLESMQGLRQLPRCYPESDMSLETL